VFTFPNLYSTRFRPGRYRPDGMGYWSGHLPFAADLIDNAKPSVLVELGTHYGESYFGFCQAIQERRIDCTSYAVDNWTGDLHTGLYGSAVFEAVSAHNAAHYSSFSTLLRRSFDEAAGLFEDRTVDLLHLDGCHTYDAVKHDFETWLPKVSIGGIILIHDIDVRKDDFGVWRLWEEVSGCFPSFAFHHSCGLGVLINNQGDAVDTPFLAALVGGGSDPEGVREYYEFCAERLSHNRASARDGIYKCQLYSPGVAGYREERSVIADVFGDQPTSVELEVPVPNGTLRLDPVNCAAVVEISEIVVECAASGSVVWRLDSSRLDDILCAGTSFRLPDERRLIILSYGDDPQLHLPLIELPERTEMLRFRCCIRVDAGSNLANQLFERCWPTLVEVRESLEQANAELTQANAELAKLRPSLDYSNSELERSRANYQAAVLRSATMQQSLSWKITAPLRRLGSLLRFGGTQG
jgi:hypothetical protein